MVSRFSQSERGAGMSRAINGTLRKVLKCQECAKKEAVTALLGWGGFKDLCRECAIENGANDSDLDDCEGCDYTPCICHVPQSERWEGR